MAINVHYLCNFDETIKQTIHKLITRLMRPKTRNQLSNLTRNSHYFTSLLHVTFKLRELSWLLGEVWMILLYTRTQLYNFSSMSLKEATRTFLAPGRFTKCHFNTYSQQNKYNTTLKGCCKKTLVFQILLLWLTFTHRK